MNKAIIAAWLLLLFAPYDYGQSSENILIRPGHFFIGCNYWASNAGTQMWVDWKPEVIEQDFKRLSEADVEVLRVFPIWRDFQPITAIRNARSGIIDYRFGENPLPDNRFGDSGLSEYMVKLLNFKKILKSNKF